MTSIIGIGVPKVNAIGCFSRLYKIPKNHNVSQVAFLKRLAFQTPINKPAPFPYWRKNYNFYHQVFDKMLYRFDENSKVVVVDGLPAVGKNKFCEKLADELGLLYIPAPSHEQNYITIDGFDTRQFDPQLSPVAKSFTLDSYLQSPVDIRTPKFQLIYFLMRYEQYLNALYHLMSTGQGVVLNRCVYSDIVFVDAMLNAGHVKQNLHKYYMDLREVVLKKIIRPHLIIYLDVPVEAVKDKIKQRGRPNEISSGVLTTQYLSDIEKSYRENYLNKLAEHSHLLAYDWTKGGDVMRVVDDIEELDLDDYKGNKLSDWVFTDEDDLKTLRTNYQQKFDMFVDLDERDITEDFPEELFVEASDVETLENLWQEHLTETALIKRSGKNAVPKELGLKWAGWSFRLSPQDFVNRPKYMT